MLYMECKVSLVLLRLFMGGMNVFKKSSFFNSNSTSLHKVDTFFQHKNSGRVGHIMPRCIERWLFLLHSNSKLRFFSLTQKRWFKAKIDVCLIFIPTQDTKPSGFIIFGQQKTCTPIRILCIQT